MSTNQNQKVIPLSPSWTRYSPDGQGRDDYIRFDNGGLLGNLYKIRSKEDFGVFDNKKYYNIQKNLAPLQYISDGSGRDSYVLHQSGGLKRNYKTLNSYHLVDILRKKEYGSQNHGLLHIRNRQQNTDFNGEFFTTDKEKKHMKKIKKLENNLIERLYRNESPSNENNIR